jgi:chorismate mutase
MYDQCIREIAGGLFYAMLSLYDDDCERESVQRLRDLIETGAARDPLAREIFRSIVRNSRASRSPEPA